MVADAGNDVLARVAAGETLELDAWPALQNEILARLEKIAHTEFTIPSLPPPPKLRRALNNGAATSSSPTEEPSSQEANKENAPVPTGGEAKDGGIKTENADEQQRKEPTTTTTSGDSDTVMEKADEATTTEMPNREASTQTSTQPAAAADGAPSSESIAADDGSDPSSSQPKLPIQLATMLGDIRSHIQTFVRAPPHTLQRLVELVLHPRTHYRALATYLHAVDRVVQVTSGLNTYPLPPAIPDMSSMHINGADGSKDPAAAVSWSTLTVGTNAAAAVGSDEALGGALLTPIPWLTRRSPESVDAASTSSGAGSSTGGASSSGGGSGGGGSGAGGGGSGAQIHSECTETIDGPNGVGSIETVSVSVNGVPSTGHARGVTQGELLRQEQRAGVVPVSQLSRNGGHPQHPQHMQQHHALQSQREAHGDGSDEDEDEDHDHHDDRQPMDEDRPPQTDVPAEEDDGNKVEEEEEEMPHARGPDEIGVGDTGPQTATTSTMGEGGLEMQGIDVAAAVGRPREQEEHPQASPMRDEDQHADAKAEATATAEEPEEGTGMKREAEDAAESEPAKKLKEE